uniref:TBC1 domain family member 20 n=1 Tax=Sarcoptes scabiei TaxID=52283 RepID=A0A834R3A1_SARSC
MINNESSELNQADSMADPNYKTFKILLILESFKRNDRVALRSYSTSAGGFLENSLRAKIWTKLANLEDQNAFGRGDADSDDENKFSIDSLSVQSNENYRQVILDVERSLKRFPPSVEEMQRISYQDSLTKLIILILNKNPFLNYYQGYHDICLTFLLIMDEFKASRLIERISLSHLKYYMEKTMQTTSDLLDLIYFILKQEDFELHDYLIRSEVGTIFSLSWVITWFSHVLTNLDDILRLFDFFISTHFLMPIYLTVSILLYKKSEILTIDCEMASMHKFLTSIPEHHPLPIDQLVHRTLMLSIKYPPEDTLLKHKEYCTTKNDSNPEQNFSLIQKFLIGNKIISLAFVGLFTACAYQYFYDYIFHSQSR